jgi:hypothetical protein
MARVVKKRLGQKLHRDVAAQFGIRSLIDLPHPAGAEMIRDSEVPECGANHRADIIRDSNDAF